MKKQSEKNPQKLKEMKVCVNYPNLLDSQTFQILLVHHPNLSTTLSFNNPSTLLVTVSGNNVCQ